MIKLKKEPKKKGGFLLVLLKQNMLKSFPKNVTFCSVVRMPYDDKYISKRVACNEFMFLKQTKHCFGKFIIEKIL